MGRRAGWQTTTGGGSEPAGRKGQEETKVEGRGGGTKRGNKSGREKCRKGKKKERYPAVKLTSPLIPELQDHYDTKVHNESLRVGNNSPTVY